MKPGKYWSELSEGKSHTGAERRGTVNDQCFPLQLRASADQSRDPFPQRPAATWVIERACISHYVQPRNLKGMLYSRTKYSSP